MWVLLSLLGFGGSVKQNCELFFRFEAEFRMIPVADNLYDDHLETLRNEGLI